MRQGAVLLVAALAAACATTTTTSRHGAGAAGGGKFVASEPQLRVVHSQLQFLLPDDWELDETSGVAVVAPKPPHDDGLVVFLVPDRPSEVAPLDALHDYVPLDAVVYESRKQADKVGQTDAVIDRGRAQLAGISVAFTAARLSSGPFVVALHRVDGGADAAKTIASLFSSLHVLPKPAAPRHPQMDHFARVGAAGDGQ